MQVGETGRLGFAEAGFRKVGFSGREFFLIIMVRVLLSLRAHPGRGIPLAASRYKSIAVIAPPPLESCGS